MKNSSTMFNSIFSYCLLIAASIFADFGMATVCFAQQPTATISILEGDVLASIQGQEAVAATIGSILQAGDTIQTQAGANVVLTLLDGSELQLGENTNLDIAVLAQDAETGARTSVIKLMWGKVRAFLSPGHQKEGSEFTFETPNALAGVKFSQPYVEVGYELETDTSVIAAHTVSVVVTNRRTGERKKIDKQHQVTVKKRRSIESSRIPPEKQTIFQKMPPPPGQQSPPNQQLPPPGQQPPPPDQQPPPGQEPPPDEEPPPRVQDDPPERNKPPDKEEKPSERKERPSKRERRPSKRDKEPRKRRGK
jgi:hypothetical protein